MQSSPVRELWSSLRVVNCSNPLKAPTDTLEIKLELRINSVQKLSTSNPPLWRFLVSYFVV